MTDTTTTTNGRAASSRPRRRRPREVLPAGGGVVRSPERGGASWRKDPDGRRERVVGEATRLFSERGFSAVSTGDIARAAGVAEGNIFHYFGSKQGLLRAVGERYGTAFAAAMFSGVEPVANRATIRQVVSRAFGFVAGNWPGFGLFLLSDDPSSAPLAQKANREVVTRSVEGVLAAWTTAGVLVNVDAPVVAHLLFGLVEASLRACFAGPEPAATARFEEATVAAISRVLGIGLDPDA
jgi:AcrR family transcriptional regulator